MRTKSQIGKASRAAGSRFELKVRKDLEDKGWIVSKWMNNIKEGQLIASKHKFRGPGIPMAIGTGFPDFIAFTIGTMFDGKGKDLPLKKGRFELYDDSKRQFTNKCNCYEIHGVEVKSNGYLDKDEKEKCKWLIDNNIFSKILIAKKGKKRGEIEYNEFKIK